MFELIRLNPDRKSLADKEEWHNIGRENCGDKVIEDADQRKEGTIAVFRVVVFQE